MTPLVEALEALAFHRAPVSEANPEMVAEARAPAADLHNRAVEVDTAVMASPMAWAR